MMLLKERIKKRTDTKKTFLKKDMFDRRLFEIKFEDFLTD